jgi:hypothetical protein
MFFLEDLKALSTTKLRQKLQDLWDTELFPECVRNVYASTAKRDCMMRFAIVEIAAAHARALDKKEIFKELLQEGGDFAVDYVHALTNMCRK